MATKNIARTVIEGGRHPFNKSERRGVMARHRAAERAFAHRARRDPDAAGVEPRRQRVAKDFDDKLGPAERWLARQEGRRWDSVYADIRARFDVRTTAGRHIVFDHLLRWVRTGPDHSFRFYGRFFVDERGILRSEPRRRRREPPAPGIVARPRDVVRAWRSGRRVGFRGAIPFWFVAGYTNGLSEVLGWRQHRRLDEQELAFFRSLDRAGLEEVLLR